MRNWIFVILAAASSIANAADIIPIGAENNQFYYQIGGSADFALPPVSDTTTIRLDTEANLGMGNSCSALNPALSISNSMNELKDSVDNLEQSIVASATGSLIQLPMYLLAQANPTAYNLLNNTLLEAHKRLDVSIKSCEVMKDQIAKGQDPYQDWGTISVNDQWKKHLTFVSAGNEDINHSKKEIDANSGDAGVLWVQGNTDVDSSLHAGGKSQPPIHTIADTVKAGYNAMLNRDLQNETDAPSSNHELKQLFPNPRSASNWITSVVGDQVITTCNDDNCKKQQGSVVGRGLLPWVTACQTNSDCVETIRGNLGNLVTGSTTITKASLSEVSASGIAVSPDVIASIRNLDEIQQKMLIGKLAQDIALQRVMDKAFIARSILAMGAQVPVIAANHPAQEIIRQALANLDNDIRSLAFESQVRKQMVSSTLAETLKFSRQQQQRASQIAPVSSNSPLVENGAIMQESAQ